MNPKSLFDIFRKFGVVRDVYIPQKRRKVRNTRFAFVRFDCAVAAEVAVQKANGIWVEDKRHEAKHADYAKGKPEENGYHQLKPKASLAKGRGGSSVWKPATGCRTYAEVTKNTNTMGGEIVTIKAKEVGIGWLYDSVVVRLKPTFATVNLKEEIQERGIKQVLVRDGGGRDVLISFKSKEERKANLETIKQWFQDWSEEIVEWEPERVRVKERMVWLCCYGIPWNLWKRATLNRIGKLWGEVICIEGDLCNPVSFECAKIQIVTRCIEPINQAINLECKGTLHSVRVWEQYPGVSKALVGSCKCSKRYGREENCSSNMGAQFADRKNVSKEVEDDDDGMMSQHERWASLRRCQEGKSHMEKGTEMRWIRSYMKELKRWWLSLLKNDDQVVMPGFVRSLSGSSFLKPRVELVVELGPSKEVGLIGGLDNKIKGVVVLDLGLKDDLQGGPQSVLGSMSLTSNMSQSLEGGVCSRLENQRRKGKKKIERKSNGKKAKKMKPGYLVKRYGYKGATSSKLGPKEVLWRAAAVAFSASSESGRVSGNNSLQEACATLQIGKLLGVKYKGNEDEVLSKILDLEAKDRERVGGGTDAAS
ncbi:hypothetical protein ACSBR2_010342 [Camellia fascicularis]